MSAPIFPSDLRAPTPSEKALFDALCMRDFPGKDVVVKQLKTCTVRQLDADGSLEIISSSDEKANVTSRVPVEICGNDEDGVAIHVLLHVIDGVCTELEIYKDSPAKIISIPKEWASY